MVRGMVGDILSFGRTKTLVKVPKEVEELVHALATFNHNINPTISRYTYETNGMKSFSLAFTGMSREQRALILELVRKIKAIGGTSAVFYTRHPYFKTSTSGLCPESLEHIEIFMPRGKLEFIAPQMPLIYGEFLRGTRELLQYIIDVNSKIR